MSSIGPVNSPSIQSPTQTSSISTTGRLSSVSGKALSPAPLGAGDPKGMRAASTNSQPRL
ncbi:MAG: hypothetical protein V4629_08440 [Pseudomonadota bacterium]